MPGPVRRTRRPNRSYAALAVGLVIGAILGGILGELLRHSAPFLANNYPIGLAPSTVDLSILAFTVGFRFKISIMTVVGAIAGLVVVGRR